MSGRELAAQVRVLRPGLPVLFTSGYTDGEILRRGLLEPGAAFVQKPFAPDAIARLVRQGLEAASLPAATPPPPGAGSSDSREPA
jgi:FixJ family two-component response regulator